MSHPKKQHGMVFLVAMLALVVMFCIGVSFMGLATEEYVIARQDTNRLQALAFAEGGANYMIWKQNYATNPISSSTISSVKFTNTHLTQIHSVMPADLVTNWTDVNAATIGITQILDTTTNKMKTAEGVNVTLPFASSAVGATVNITPLSPLTSGNTTVNGFQIVSVGQCNGVYRRCRVVFQGGSTTTGTAGTWNAGDQTFKYAVQSGSNMTMAGACNITGNLGINGNLDLGASGNIAGNTNVNGNLTLSGNSQISGAVAAAGNLTMSGSAKLLGGTKVLGTVSLGYDTIQNGIQSNGAMNLGGSTVTGTVATPSSVAITWGFNGPSAVNYGTSFSQPGQIYSGATKTTVTPLPSTTGSVGGVPAIDFSAYKNMIFQNQGTNDISLTTVTNGAGPKGNGTAFTLPAARLDWEGDFNASSGTNPISSAANTRMYVSGNLTLGGSTNWTTTGTGDMYIYVHGNVNVGGSVNITSTGKVFIIADGQLNITGGYNFGNTNVRLFSQTSVSVNSNGRNVYGLVYAHNSSGTGTVNLSSAQIVGASLADVMNITGSGSVYADPTDPLPGTGTGGGTTTSSTAATWNIASWEAL